MEGLVYLIRTDKKRRWVSREGGVDLCLSVSDYIVPLLDIPRSKDAFVRYDNPLCPLHQLCTFSLDRMRVCCVGFEGVDDMCYNSETYKAISLPQSDDFLCYN